MNIRQILELSTTGGAEICAESKTWGRGHKYHVLLQPTRVVDDNDIHEL